MRLGAADWARWDFAHGVILGLAAAHQVGVLDVVAFARGEIRGVQYGVANVGTAHVRKPSRQIGHVDIGGQRRATGMHHAMP